MKFKRTVAQLFGLILLFGMLVYVYAQRDNPSDRSGRRQRPFDREEMLKRFDKDGDGELSEEEREAMRDRLGAPPGFRGGRRGGRMRQEEELVDRFDDDGDGKLNDEERKTAREYLQDSRDARRDEAQPARETTVKKPDLAEIVEESKNFSYDPNADLYDETVLRTLYLQFSNADWYEELGDFYKTDVEVPADLIVDGKVYRSVGVGFRGNTSYMMVRSQKKPFNIAIDYGDSKQRLYGYKTLNLMNCHSDPSFVREVLFSRICREYIPAPKANFVKLVINGENWGVYVNLQQFNKDFLRDWFGSKNGARWKVSPGRNRGGALVWNGPELANYKNAYQLKTKDSDKAWKDLINLCDVLNNTPDDQLKAALNPIFNIDRTLWFIALENIFIDSDSYISRGSDYLIYQDRHGRFNLLSYDNNETFRFAGGGGPNMWPSNDQMLSPVGHEDSEERPVISRLLSIPDLRARYLAHVRTITNEWLDWEVLAPIIEEYQSLIDAEVKADDKKLYSYEGFVNAATEDYSGGEDFGPLPGTGGPPPGGFGAPSDDRRGDFGRRGGGPRVHVVPSLKRFVDERREFLLNHPELDKPAPSIKIVSQPTDVLTTNAVQIKAEVSGDVELSAVNLYFVTEPNLPFESVSMSNDGNIYVGEIPTFPAGTEVHYYVEARAIGSAGTSSFTPANAELGAFTYRVTAPIAESSPIVINELMTSNTMSLTDPQGDTDDWIELHNLTDQEIVLSGMYLSDKKDNPRKWIFPENTKISPSGYLIVWADEDGKDTPGLHANFKLSISGELVMLVDKDERGNKILDSIEFGQQDKDVAYGRLPDGTGEFKKLTLTPGKKNK